MQAYSFRLYLEYARAVHPDRDTGVMVRTRLFSLFTPFVERRADLSLERRTTNLALDLHRRARRLKKPRARRRRRSLGLELSNPSRSLPLRKLEQEEESSLVVGHQPSLPNDNLLLPSHLSYLPLSLLAVGPLVLHLHLRSLSPRTPYPHCIFSHAFSPFLFSSLVLELAILIIN